MKPVPEELRALFKRWVILLAGFGLIQPLLCLLCNEAGLKERMRYSRHMQARKRILTQQHHYEHEHCGQNFPFSTRM